MIKPANRKPLAITMGEPAGVGPELIARLWQDRAALGLPSFIYYGAATALKSVAPNLPLHLIQDPSEAMASFVNALPVYDIAAKADIIPGEANPENGSAVVTALRAATKATQDGETAALVTAPINKAVLYNAGFDAPGHTEYLARLCGLPDSHSIMMLTAQNLRVVPVTIHIALKDVPKNLTAEKIIHAGLVTDHDLRLRFGIEKPRIAIAALNPHAGEGGAMGMEEATHIMPAVWTLRDQGLSVTDPLPADTLFHAEARENYDAVLCMYHDQALIPVKTLDFWAGVNVTLGLPIIRTSPDHGTALSLAGKGIARTDSMLAAIRMAGQLAFGPQA